MTAAEIHDKQDREALEADIGCYVQALEERRRIDRLFHHRWSHMPLEDLNLSDVNIQRLIELEKRFAKAGHFQLAGVLRKLVGI